MGTFSHLIAILPLAPPASGEQQTGGWVQLVPFALIFIIFYIVVFAPMRKKQKKQAEMIGNLKAGDRVITSGGIHGTVVGVAEHIVHLKIADQVKIELSKSAVAGLVPPDA